MAYSRIIRMPAVPNYPQAIAAMRIIPSEQNSHNFKDILIQHNEDTLWFDGQWSGVGTCLGQGGSKRVYCYYKAEEKNTNVVADCNTNGLGLQFLRENKIQVITPKKVITLPNLDANSPETFRWTEMVHEETYVADTLRTLGLLTPDHEIVSIKIRMASEGPQFELPVLQTTYFNNMEGLKIIEPSNICRKYQFIKNRDSYRVLKSI